LAGFQKLNCWGYENNTFSFVRFAVSINNEGNRRIIVMCSFQYQAEDFPDETLFDEVQLLYKKKLFFF